ncbi:hypothetical protein PL372_11920 [Tenacibaculum dicentrarchi]|nr:hypothetical protein [Tenacibaculum dicentrarchi]
MNAFAQKYKVGHASIEEHPESTLYYNKVDEYINDNALNNIHNPEINSISDLDKLVKENDIIVIDSFAKMQEIQKGFEVDKDLRKKYDGKLFIVEFFSKLRMVKCVAVQKASLMPILSDLFI